VAWLAEVTDGHVTVCQERFLRRFHSITTCNQRSDPAATHMNIFFGLAAIKHEERNGLDAQSFVAPEHAFFCVDPDHCGLQSQAWLWLQRVHT